MTEPQKKRQRRDRYGMVACPPGAVMHVTCDDCGATKDVEITRSNIPSGEYWMNGGAAFLRRFDPTHQCSE
jgi:hypothetical protein